jgi:7-cyano-7-deazaguanine reductase
MSRLPLPGSLPAPSNDPAGSPLGKAVRYGDRYDPALLFPVSRAGKRVEIGLDEARALPFDGEDLWNAWELSWLNPRGKPVVAVGEFRFPATSPRLIESKSLKLYLNAFNQTPFDSPDAVASRIANVLSAAAGTTVAVKLQALDDRVERTLGVPDGILIDGLDIDIADFDAPAPQLLTADRSAPVVAETLYSHLLKSNCLVTGQPDWGMLVVRYRGRPIDRAGLLRYIVSFRRHHEFHEHCVERVFMDLVRRCAPERLEVWARYTRRGGLDINPWRSSESAEPPPNVCEVRQ